jgi:hypothetical protein
MEKCSTVICLLKISCPSDLVRCKKTKRKIRDFLSKLSPDILLETRPPPLTGMVFLGLWHDSVADETPPFQQACCLETLVKCN